MTTRQCSCGREYTAAEWDALPSLAPQYYPDETGQWWRMVMRNCAACHSTRADEPVAVDASEVPELDRRAA